MRPWFVVSLALAGCDSFPPISCTEIGCSSGLTLEMRGVGAADRDIDVAVEVGDRSYACAGTVDPVDGLSCGGEIRILAIGEDSLEIRLGGVEGEAPVQARVSIDGIGWFDDEVEVDWGEPDQPNGEGCPPTCWSGEGRLVAVEF